jgi:hypothetical protein
MNLCGNKPFDALKYTFAMPIEKWGGDALGGEAGCVTAQ